MVEHNAAEPQPFAGFPHSIEPLGYRDFALYLLGMLTTNTGRWIELTGVVWLVYELTDSPLLVGLLGAARALPAFLLSPVAGVVADRVDQRRLLLLTQALSLFFSLVLALLVMKGEIQLWMIYLQVLLQASINAFDASTRQALFPRLVPRRILASAVTLSIAAVRLSKFAGPALGGLLIAAYGESAPFFANAVSFVAMMAAVVFMSATPVVVTAVRSFGNDFLEGVRYILSAPVLRGVMTLELVYGIFETNPAMIAILGREILDVGPRELGFLLAAPALGSFAGLAWLLIVRRRSRHGRLSICCTFGYAVILSLLACSSSYLFAFTALSVIGVLEVIIVVTRHSILQLSAPERMRGRVMANMGMITRGIGPLAETQSGLLASAFGLGGALLVAASVIGSAAVLTAKLNPALWRYSLYEK